MTSVPDEVALLRDFINTAEPQVQREDLTSPVAVQEWLAAHAIPIGTDPDVSFRPADVRRLRALRETLRAVLYGHAGHDMGPSAVDALNVELAYFPLRMSFDVTGRPTVAARSNRPLDVAVGTLLAAVQAAARDGTWERLKTCSRDTCRWAFYDNSRNRSGRWCSMSGCGNIVKMRRAHARRSNVASSATV